MKYLFAIIATVLVFMAIGTFYSYPDARSGVPVIYWVTDANPARVEQINLFHQWLIKEGYTKTFTAEAPKDLANIRNQLSDEVVDDILRIHPEVAGVFFDDEDDIKDLAPDLVEMIKPHIGKELKYPVTVLAPKCEMKTDSANRDTSKQIIQGVSGVGGDVMDLNGGGGMRFFQDIGLLEDVTEDAKRLGFDASKTYDAMLDELTIINDEGERRQFQFPCNVSSSHLWVNKDTFARYGVRTPPRRWTIEEFEALGKEFVKAANPEGERVKVFFAASVQRRELHRSMGLSRFNETLTECTLDDPRSIEVAKLIYKWTYEDHLLPSASDRASFDTQAGYGGASAQLFNRGNYAMLQSGRWILIQFRKFGSMNLDVVEPPYVDMPVTATGTRAAAVYRGGKNKDLAKLFLAFLASEDYNMQIVHDGDALTPIPAYTETEEFRNPADYPNEHGLHEIFSDSVATTAVGGVYCPYVLEKVASRIEQKAVDSVMAHQMSAEVALDEATVLINKEIARTLKEMPELRPRYEEGVKLQKKIDELRAKGEKVPLEWIANPFYRKYYQFKGWAE